VTVLIVPQSLYGVADRVMNTKVLRGTELGNYQQFQYKDDKPHWERVKNKESIRPFKIDHVIRRRYEDDEYAMTKSFHLPKAMKKQGYVVEKVFEVGRMQDDYDPKIVNIKES